MATNITTSAIGVNNNETYYEGTSAATWTEYQFARNQKTLIFKNTGSHPLHVLIDNADYEIMVGEEKKINQVCQSFKTSVGTFTVLSENDIVLYDEVNAVKAAIANFEETGGGGGVTEAQVKTIMAPLVNAVTAGLTITAPSGSLEVGKALTSVGFSWTIGNHGSAKSAKIRDTSANADIETLTVAASGTHTETVSITKTAPATQNYRLDVVDNLDRTISSTVRAINWYWATYCGNSTSTSLDATGLKALTTKTLKSSRTGDYAIANATGYKYIAYPKSFGEATFKDAATGFAVSMQPVTEVTITNDQGVEVVMYVYRTVNQLSGAITITAA